LDSFPTRRSSYLNVQKVFGLKDNLSFHISLPAYRLGKVFLNFIIRSNKRVCQLFVRRKTTFSFSKVNDRFYKIVNRCIYAVCNNSSSKGGRNTDIDFSLFVSFI